MRYFKRFIDTFVEPEDIELVGEVIRWAVTPGNDLNIFVSVVGEAATRFLQVMRMLAYDHNGGGKAATGVWEPTLPKARLLFLHRVPERPDNLQPVIDFGKLFCASELSLILPDSLQEQKIEIRLKPGSAAKIHVDSMKNSRPIILRWAK